MGDTSVGVFNVNAQIATQANPHWGMQAGPHGRAHTCDLPASAHCGLWAGVHVRHGGSCDRKSAMPIRCLIVDDNSGFRQEMGGLLREQGLEVVGGGGSAAEALQQTAELRPDVALTAIAPGRESGLPLAPRFREPRGPGVRDVILISP